MARPREFDREAALQAAIGVFWAKGYAGASTDDLTGAMGIGRQSLYDTFGDKRRLYLEALARYNVANVEGHVATLRAGASASEAISRLLVDFAQAPDDARERGCFGVNAICEFGAADAQVSEISHAGATAIEAALEQLIEAGKATGDLDPDLDAKAAATFINVTLAGLKVQAKAGASADLLSRTALFAVNRLRP